MQVNPRATIEDLYHVEGKAELVDGEISHMAPSGEAPGFASLEIATSLRPDTRATDVYRASAPDMPAVYRRGEMAEAEAAAPGWRLAVNALFPGGPGL
ncbi:MAG: hypothetical protein AB7N91_11885 [Candidatus Tectimicrobiota bacterium]